MISLGTEPDLDVAQLGMLGPDLFHPSDDLVDRIEAEKRQVAAGESPGATIDVWVVDEDTNSATEPVNIDADPINADWIKVGRLLSTLPLAPPEDSFHRVKRRFD